MIQYFLEVTIAWTLFYSIYFFFLKKETFFNVNRWYLIHTLWIGALIPLLKKLPIYFESTQPIITEPVAFIQYSTQYITNTVEAPLTTHAFDYLAWVVVAYFIGVLFSSFRMVLGLYRIYGYYQLGEKQKLGQITLVVSDSFHLPFSFLDKVFVHRTLMESPSFREILDHEITHVKSRHTYDVLFMEAMSIFYWWNPIIYLYKKSLRQTHEYVADAYASQHSQKKNYGHILLGQSSSGIELALTNQFFNTHLKKRITMLYKEKSARHKLGKYLLVIPLFLFLCALYSFDSDTIPKHVQQRINEIPVDQIIDCYKTEQESCDKEILKTTFSLVNDFPEHLEEIIVQVEKRFKDKGHEINIVHDGPQFLELDKPESLKAELDAKLDKEFFTQTKEEAFMKGESILSSYKRLIKKYAFYEEYIQGEFERRAMFYGSEIKIIKDEDSNYSIVKSPVSNLRLMISHDSDILKAGETYTFTAIHPNVKEADIKINFSPSIGHSVIQSSKDVRASSDNSHSFSYSPERATGPHEDFTVSVSSGDEVAIMKFKIIGSDKAEEKKENEIQKKEIITLHNGEKIDLDQSDSLTVDGHIEHIDDKKIIKKRFGLDIDENTSVINLVGEVREIKSSKKQAGSAIKRIVSPETYVSEREYYTEGMTDPLIVINGKISESDDEHYFTESKIQTIDVLKGEAAIAKYGYQAKRGVIEFNILDKPVQSDNEEVFKVVQEMPRFPGCEDIDDDKEARSKCSLEKLSSWIQSNIVVPPHVIKERLDGKVYIQFIVEKDGSLSNIKVVREIHDCGSSAIELLKKMNHEIRWIPGKQRGKKVRVLFTLPIKYAYQNQDEKHSDQSALNMPPHPPLPPEVAIQKLLDECEEPVILVNDQRITKEAFHDLDQSQWLTLKVSDKCNLMEEYKDNEDDCGVILLTTKEEVENSTDVTVKSNVDCDDPIFIVDGERMNAPEDIDPDDIEKIYVYKDEVPDRYMEYKNTCGIVEIITKRGKRKDKKKVKEERDRIEPDADKKVLVEEENHSDMGQEDYRLNQNVPNPFRDRTTIEFYLPAEQEATLHILNVEGKVVKEISEIYTKGKNSIEIRKEDLSSPGVYYYQLQSGKFSKTRKFILVEGKQE